jgi:hypothetical protein
MPKNISKELEVAILSIPQKDKDKLLLRLIAKNDILTEQLHYKLLENEEDLRMRREELKEFTLKYLKKKYPYGQTLLSEIREINSAISRHKRVTTDKYGEIELVVNMFLVVFQYQDKHLETYSAKIDKLTSYLVKRAISLLKTFDTLHEDYKFDFTNDLNDILAFMHSKATTYYAKQLNLPRSID